MLKKASYRLILLSSLILSSGSYSSLLKDNYFLAQCLKKNLSPDFVHSVFLAESGRTKNKVFAPWPYTLRSEKGSYYFETKNEAEKKLLKWQQEGILNIDIGYGQVNLFYHAKRVEKMGRKTRDLLDPQFNIRVATDILAENVRLEKDLEKALQRYNAGANLAKGKGYAERVGKIYKKLACGNQDNSSFLLSEYREKVCGYSSGRWVKHGIASVTTRRVPENK